MEGLGQSLIQLKMILSNMAYVVLDVGRLMQPAMKNLLLVMLGGGIGAATRYGVNLLAARAWGPYFPWGTLTVNLTGCFLIGLLVALADRGRFLTPEMRLLLITGFLGAMTTFSTFSLETVNAVRADLTLRPIINIAVNNVGGLTLTLFGLWLGNLK
jgi:fluoride exporter